MIRYNTTTNKFEAYQNSAWTDMISSGGSSLSGLTAATATNTIDNLNFAQTWNWSTATTQSPISVSANALTTGSLLNLTTSNATLNSTNGLLNVANTGASTSGVVARIQSNSAAGTGLTVLANGNVGIGTASPAQALDVAGNITATGSISATGAGTGFVELASGAAPAAPAAGVANVFVNASGVLQCQYGAGSSECLPSYNTANNAVGANVTMVNVNQFYDGPSVTLAAGTWMVQGTVTIATTSVTTAIPVTCKLWDGTTVSSSSESTAGAVAAAAVRHISISLQAIVSPAASTVYKISCASTIANQVLRAAATDNGAGNNASTIWSFRLK